MGAAPLSASDFYVKSVLLGYLEAECYRAGDGAIEVPLRPVFLCGYPQFHAQAAHVVGQSFHPPADLGYVLVKFCVVVCRH